MVTNNISEIRKEKHLSQDDLAVALGVCRKSIFNIEHNNVIPNIDRDRFKFCVNSKKLT